MQGIPPMGCDIHMFCEVRKGGKWEKVGEVFKDPYYHPDKPEDEWNIKFTDSPYLMRNYDLFAILADVRNGHGFAGIRTGDRFNAIANPRGLPDDVSEKVKEESDHWGVDGHSRSFFTVAELLAYDWNQQTGHSGVVNLQGYLEWHLKGRAEEWCGAISGPDIRMVTNKEMDAIANTLDMTKLKPSVPLLPEDKAMYVLKSGTPLGYIPYTGVSWYESYTE